MSYKYKCKETYNADDEEPKCHRCDHLCDSYERFCSKCGPEHWWHYYIRTEIRDVEVSEELAKRIKAIVWGRS